MAASRSAADREYLAGIPAAYRPQVPRERKYSLPVVSARCCERGRAPCSLYAVGTTRKVVLPARGADRDYAVGTTREVVLPARGADPRIRDCAPDARKRRPIADTIVAPATPPGEGAVGMLRLSGPGCLKIASSFIRPMMPSPSTGEGRLAPRESSHSLPAAPSAYRAATSSSLPASTARLPSRVYFRSAPRTATLAEAFADGRLLDRVVATFFPGPASYTGEDVLEVTAHGSPFILSRLLESARRAGARLADPGEFTQRAYLNGRMDLAQAEAVCALIRSRTRSAHRAALEQLNGGLSKRMKELRQELLDVLATVEAGLDHPEEDIPELDMAAVKARMRAVGGAAASLADTYRIGKIAVEGARIAIVGAPNAGKSSLLNALLGRDRAIVSDVPGTTRDTIEELADLDGLQAVLIDTAGLRDHAADRIEQSGMERTHRAIEASDLVLLVVDRSRPLAPEEKRVIEELRGSCRENRRPVITVLNKSDLPSRFAGGSDGSFVEISALKGEGIETLARTIVRQALASSPGEDAGLIITSARHRDALERARAALQTADEKAPELVAAHLREALSAVAAISGETTADDVLHSIFSKFCVGK